MKGIILMDNKVVMVVGGDLRQIFAAKALSDNFTVYAVGFEKAPVVLRSDVIFTDLKSIKPLADIVVFPLPACDSDTTVYAPFSEKAINVSDVAVHIKADSLIFGGKLSDAFKAVFAELCADIIDYSDSEQFSVLNSLPTAEGAVMLALEEMPVTLFSTKVLLIGFGRISRALVPILKGFGANITVAARSYEALCKAKIMGCDIIHISNLKASINEFGLIYNTVPAKIITKDILMRIDSQTLVIDLASKPGGVDFDAAANMGLKTLWALSLPGKTAPESAGIIISETINNILTERGVT